MRLFCPRCGTPHEVPPASAPQPCGRCGHLLPVDGRPLADAGDGFPCPSCQAIVAPQASACGACGRPPLVCGEYRVESLLGRGGMGVVLGARRLADGAGVAAKVLWLGQGLDWKAYELFERSTRVLQGLAHPALPRVLAFERTAAGHLVLVRERFDGGTLAGRLCDGKRLEPDLVRHLLVRLLELLRYLHGQVPPVLHRDIKPENIMFRTPGDWEPVLVDFDTVTAPGPQQARLTIVCTPGYTAPEQLAGYVSPASDLYSLGATLLFVATRREPDTLPREGGRFQVAEELGPLAPAVREVVMRLVEPDRARRIGRAEEALAALAEDGLDAALQAAGGPRATWPPAGAPRASLQDLERRGREALAQRAAAAASAAATLAAAARRNAERSTTRLGMLTTIQGAIAAYLVFGVYVIAVGFLTYQVENGQTFIFGLPEEFSIPAAFALPVPFVVLARLATRALVRRTFQREVDWLTALPFAVDGYLETLGHDFLDDIRVTVYFEHGADAKRVEMMAHGLGDELRRISRRSSGVKAMCPVVAATSSDLVITAEDVQSGFGTNFVARRWLRRLLEGLVVPLHAQYPVKGLVIARD